MRELEQKLKAEMRAELDKRDAQASVKEAMRQLEERIRADMEHAKERMQMQQQLQQLQSELRLRFGDGATSHLGIGAVHGTPAADAQGLKQATRHTHQGRVQLYQQQPQTLR